MKAGIMLLGLVLIAGTAAASAGTVQAPMPGMLQAVSSNGGEPLVTLEWNFNPEETLHYDGQNYNAIGLTGGGSFRGAVRFTPTTSCTVKSILFYQRNSSADDFVFIFAEGDDSTPGPILDSAAYTGSGNMRWKRVDFSNPVVITAGIDFWTCVRCTHLADSFPLGVDSGPIVPYRGGFISTSGGRWEQLPDNNPLLNYNWNIRAIIEPGTGLDHDVGVSRILVPGQSINPGTYPPKVRVTNFGTNSENDFDVTCWIDSAGSLVYDETHTITTALEPGHRTEVTFPDWNTGPSGAAYDMTVFTELAADQDRTNDSMMQSIAIMTGQALVDHDTGYCLLTVTAFGAIGFVDVNGAGGGFKHPKAGQQTMYYASFAMGNSPEYNADRHYGHHPDPVNDDLKPVDSLMPVVPPEFGDQQFRCKFDDSGHPDPKGLEVTQNSYMTADPEFDDFVVLAYEIHNPTGEAVDDMYAGIFGDFDLPPAGRLNRAASDTVRRLVYMRHQNTPNPTVGVKLLEPRSFANLSAIDHEVWVYKDSCMTDTQKFRFLNGDIVQRNSNRPYDWSVCTSVGPFDLAAGGRFTVAFAMFGGSNEANALANADAAQRWYRQVGLAEGAKPRRADDQAFRVKPNPFSSGTWVHYTSRTKGRLEIEVFDALGRIVDSRSTEIEPGAGRYLWQPAELAHGIYFINIKTPDQETVTKVLSLE